MKFYDILIKNLKIIKLLLYNNWSYNFNIFSKRNETVKMTIWSCKCFNTQKNVRYFSIVFTVSHLFQTKLMELLGPKRFLMFTVWWNGQYGKPRSTLIKKSRMNRKSIVRQYRSKIIKLSINSMEFLKRTF